MTTEAINYFRATASSSSRSSGASSTSSHTPPPTPNAANNMGAPPPSKHAAPALSVKARGFILFLLGSLCALVLNILQMEYKSNLFPSNVLIFLATTWWVLPLCGLAAGKTSRRSQGSPERRLTTSTPLPTSSLHRANVSTVRSSIRSSFSQRRQRMVAQHQMLLIVHRSQPSVRGKSCLPPPRS